MTDSKQLMKLNGLSLDNRPRRLSGLSLSGLSLDQDRTKISLSKEPKQEPKKENMVQMTEISEQLEECTPAGVKNIKFAFNKDRANI